MNTIMNLQNLQNPIFLTLHIPPRLSSFPHRTIKPSTLLPPAAGVATLDIAKPAHHSGTPPLAPNPVG